MAATQSPLKLGIAIPCYDRHVPLLTRVLNSIEAQSVKPSYVVISCSSLDVDQPIQESAYKYSFPLEILQTTHRQNAAQNRNLAAYRLLEKGCSYLSFFDADDVMHPQRLEAIHNAFHVAPKTRFVMHNYTPSNSDKKSSVQSMTVEKHQTKYTSISVIQNGLYRSPTGCALVKQKRNDTVQYPCHHSQSTVTADLFDKIRYREGKMYERREDALFCGDILQLNVPSAYIKESLSTYYEEGSWTFSKQKEKEKEKEQQMISKQPISDSTVVVTLTDQAYLEKCIRTLKQLRTRGKWDGDVVVLTVDFNMPTSITNELKLTTKRISHLDHTPLWEAWKTHPIPKKDDNRHYQKVTQWDKLQVFSEDFLKWKRVLFLDAGIYIFNSIASLLELPYANKMLAPDDSDPHDNGNRLKCQIHLESNPSLQPAFEKEFGPFAELGERKYFLNCVFLFDTSLIKTLNISLMRQWMYKYPIMGCNEMGIMNLFFRNHWTPFPLRSIAGEHYLFSWAENCYKTATPKANEFCLLKYPNYPA